MKKFLDKEKNCCMRLYDSFRWRIVYTYAKLSNLIPDIIILLSSRDYIVLNSWIKIRWGRLKRNNWGDDINYFFLERTVNRVPIIYSQTLLSKFWKGHNYMLIGSIIHLANENTIVWGSGVKFPDKPLKKKPFKICAVRGPITRDYLISQGIDCPEVYGDPALLLPELYMPKVSKRYDVGIIPHIWDEEKDVFMRYSKKYNAIIIDMSNYKKWTDIIDVIYSCNVILSSSLHGLIVSDAYGIPNCWLKSKESDICNAAKYKDYFMSVGRDYSLPHEIKSEIDVLKAVSDAKSNWKPIAFNTSMLWEVCPFKQKNN